MTPEALKASVSESLRGATTADLKWFYAYFNEFEEFPLVVNEPAPTYKVFADDKTLV